ncbi:MAG: hypothetical protein ABI321_07445 [Polyangia bacterium]
MKKLFAALVLAGCSRAVAPVEVANAALHWDFSSTRTIAYDYEQHMGSTDDLDEAPTLDLTVRGGMDVIATGHATANVVLRDLVMTHGEDHEAVPPALLRGVNEDGSSSATADDPRLLLLKVLAPLPHRALEPGQSDEVLIDFPVTVNGAPVVARGGAKVTLRGYEAGAAILDAVTDVGRLDVAEGQRTAYDASLHGTSTLWFSLADHALQKAELQLTMTTRASDKTGASKATRIDTTLLVARTRNAK